MQEGAVYWITGLSGAGKTTIGTKLYYRFRKENMNVILLDGDTIKEIVGGELVDYSLAGRKRRAFQYSKLCKLLSEQGLVVICCTIAMFESVRQWNRKHIDKYFEVFLDVDIRLLQKRDVRGVYKRHTNYNEPVVGIEAETEFPQNPDLTIKNNFCEDIATYIDLIVAKSAGYIFDGDKEVEYWNQYYTKKTLGDEPSAFAQFVGERIKAGHKLIDIGCGNGRDSIFFLKKGLKVTAIDSSSEAIDYIDKKREKIFTVCDDFVKAKAMYCMDYEYCYARWVLHSITEAEESELIKNVFETLSKGGKFFIEARTIHDKIYGCGTPCGQDAFIYDEHYRRFLNPQNICKKLEDTGFVIEFHTESDEYSVKEQDKPSLIRIIACKPGEK